MVSQYQSFAETLSDRLTSLQNVERYTDLTLHWRKAHFIAAALVTQTSLYLARSSLLIWRNHDVKSDYRAVLVNTEPVLRKRDTSDNRPWIKD